MAELAHAILIEGGSEASRMAKAVEILTKRFADDPAAELKLKEGVFEDLLVLEREGGPGFEENEEKPGERSAVITKDLIENILIPFIKQKPFASTGRACIIPNGERMNETAQNKLLKTLEEPTAGYVIIIMTENAEGLLQTVRSRCMRVWMGYDKAEYRALNDDVKRLASILIYGKGPLAEANALMSAYEGSREEAAAFLCAFQLFLRGMSVGRHSPGLIEGDDAYPRQLRENAGKVQGIHADLMRNGVMLAETAQNRIEQGRRIRYTLRGMALQIRQGEGHRGGN